MCLEISNNLLLMLQDAQTNAFFLRTRDLLVSQKTTHRHFFSTRHPISTVIFATATVLAFVLVRNSRFNFHCYTQREATPTQKSARKCAATSRDFLHERLQSAFTLANQLRWIAQYGETPSHTPSIAFRHLPPNPARVSYATEGSLFIAAQLSTDAVSALRKVWVLIRLWKQPRAQART